MLAPEAPGNTQGTSTRHSGGSRNPVPRPAGLQYFLDPGFRRGDGSRAFRCWGDLKPTHYALKTVEYRRGLPWYNEMVVLVKQLILLIIVTPESNSLFPVCAISKET
jgi:hypothetical protein